MECFCNGLVFWHSRHQVLGRGLTPHALDGWYAPRPQAFFWLVILSPRGVWLSPPASNTAVRPLSCKRSFVNKHISAIVMSAGAFAAIKDTEWSIMLFLLGIWILLYKDAV